MGMSVLYIILAGLLTLSVLLYVAVHVLKSKKQTFDKTKGHVKTLQARHAQAFENQKNSGARDETDRKFVPSGISAE